MNLNRQSEQATVLLIREVLQRGIELSEVRTKPSSRTTTHTTLAHRCT